MIAEFQVRCFKISYPDIHVPIFLSSLLEQVCYGISKKEISMIIIKGHCSRSSPRKGIRYPAFATIRLIAMACMLGGCTMVGPDYVKPTAPVPEEWLETSEVGDETKEMDFSTWWQVFNDPVLNALVETAYRQNLTLQVAGIRILEARAQLGIAIGDQYPQAQQGFGDAGVEKTSRNLPNAASA